MAKRFPKRTWGLSCAPSGLIMLRWCVAALMLTKLEHSSPIRHRLWSNFRFSTVERANLSWDKCAATHAKHILKLANLRAIHETYATSPKAIAVLQLIYRLSFGLRGRYTFLFTLQPFASRSIFIIIYQIVYCFRDQGKMLIVCWDPRGAFLPKEIEEISSTSYQLKGKSFGGKTTPKRFHKPRGPKYRKPLGVVRSQKFCFPGSASPYKISSFATHFPEAAMVSVTQALPAKSSQ